MKLTKPVVFFDVETTGLSLSEDRIIEISMIKYHPEDVTKMHDTESFYRKINPDGRPIAEGAFEKHGLSQENLAEEPKFAEVAQDIFDFIKDCDLGGYNCKRFDIPILIEEFLRVGIPINIKDFKIVDVFRILQKAEPRTLEATYKRFMGKDFENAHSAEADVLATIEVLKALQTEFNLPETSEELDEFTFKGDNTLDLEYKLKKTDDGNIVFSFGKYKDTTVQQVYKIDPSYFDWIIQKSTMTRYTKAIFSNIVTLIKGGKL